MFYEYIPTIFSKNHLHINLQKSPSTVSYKRDIATSFLPISATTNGLMQQQYCTLVSHTFVVTNLIAQAPR